MRPYLKALKQYVLLLPEKFTRGMAKFAVAMLENRGMHNWTPPISTKKRS